MSQGGHSSTVDELISVLQDLSKQGHGDKIISLNGHEYSIPQKQTPSFDYEGIIDLETSGAILDVSWEDREFLPEFLPET